MGTTSEISANGAEPLQEEDNHSPTSVVSMGSYTNSDLFSESGYPTDLIASVELYCGEHGVYAEGQDRSTNDILTRECHDRILQEKNDPHNFSKFWLMITFGYNLGKHLDEKVADLTYSRNYFSLFPNYFQWLFKYKGGYQQYKGLELDFISKYTNSFGEHSTISSHIVSPEYGVFISKEGLFEVFKEQKIIMMHSSTMKYLEFMASVKTDDNLQTSIKNDHTVNTSPADKKQSFNASLEQLASQHKILLQPFLQIAHPGEDYTSGSPSSEYQSLYNTIETITKHTNNITHLIAFSGTHKYQAISALMFNDKLNLGFVIGDDQVVAVINVAIPVEDIDLSTLVTTLYHIVSKVNADYSDGIPKLEGVWRLGNNTTYLSRQLSLKNTQGTEQPE